MYVRDGPLVVRTRQLRQSFEFLALFSQIVLIAIPRCFQYLVSLSPLPDFDIDNFIQIGLRYRVDDLHRDFRLFTAHADTENLRTLRELYLELPIQPLDWIDLP